MQTSLDRLEHEERQDRLNRLLTRGAWAVFAAAAAGLLLAGPDPFWLVAGLITEALGIALLLSALRYVLDVPFSLLTVILALIALPLPYFPEWPTSLLASSFGFALDSSGKPMLVGELISAIAVGTVAVHAVRWAIRRLRFHDYSHGHDDRNAALSR